MGWGSWLSIVISVETVTGINSRQIHDKSPNFWVKREIFSQIECCSICMAWLSAIETNKTTVCWYQTLNFVVCSARQRCCFGDIIQTLITFYYEGNAVRNEKSFWKFYQTFVVKTVCTQGMRDCVIENTHCCDCVSLFQLSQAFSIMHCVSFIVKSKQCRVISIFWSHHIFDTGKQSCEIKLFLSIRTIIFLFIELQTFVRFLFFLTLDQNKIIGRCIELFFTDYNEEVKRFVVDWRKNIMDVLHVILTEYM